MHGWIFPGLDPSLPRPELSRIPLNPLSRLNQEDDTYEFAYSFPFTYTALQYELGYLEFIGSPCMRRQLLTRCGMAMCEESVLEAQRPSMQSSLKAGLLLLAFNPDP